MKKCTLAALALSFVVGLAVAQREGGISPSLLKKLEQQKPITGARKALRNALASEDIQRLALNADNPRKYDREFSHRVKSAGITDQHSSGRCWLFTGQNVLRSKVIDRYSLKEFKFSHVYPFFYDQLEKANLFLQAMIDNAQKPEEDRMVEWLFKHPLQDGGQYTGVSDILSKYGAVPEEVMPETYSSKNTRNMAKILSYKLREGGIRIRQAASQPEKMQQIKEQYLAQVYSVLELCLGTPPKQFEYSLKDKEGKLISKKTYTPQSFLKEMLPETDLKGDFVMLMNDPSRPYFKLYEIQLDRHSYDGSNWRYLNLPMEEITAPAIASIKNNEMMYFSCDVGKGIDSKAGTLDTENYDYEDLLGISMGMDKAERIRSFQSGSSHAMTLVGVDLDAEGQPKKWLIENSWGEKSGYNGHLVMTHKWFQEYMFRLVVRTRYLSPRAAAALQQEATILPPWDPMF